jgi:hypothetical protein
VNRKPADDFHVCRRTVISATTGSTSSAITVIRRMGRPFFVHMKLGQPNNGDNIVSNPNDPAQLHWPRE